MGESRYNFSFSVLPNAFLESSAVFVAFVSLKTVTLGLEVCSSDPGAQVMALKASVTAALVKSESGFNNTRSV